MTGWHSVGLVLAIAALAACTSNSANPSHPSSSEEAESSPAYEADIPAIERDLEGQIDEKVSRQWHRGVAGTRVDCPSDVHWQVGDSFRCDVSVPGFPPGLAEVSIESDDGNFSWYISNQ